VLLVVGAAVTVGVAWAIVLALPKPSIARVATRYGNEPWPVHVPGDWPSESDKTSVSGVYGWRMSAQTSPAVFYVIVTETGAPFLAMRTVEMRWWTDKSEGRRSVGLAIPRSIAERSVRGLLPVIPIWTGFAANTVVYSLGIAAIRRTIASIKRRRRVRAGRCVDCGYQLSSDILVCPECGARQCWQTKLSLRSALNRRPDMPSALHPTSPGSWPNHS
jgi:hypothetical protein